MHSRSWQLLLPLFALPLFLQAFLRTERRWQECHAEASSVCLPYPLYLRYEIHQQLDLHNLALLPAALLNLLPASVSFNPNPSTQLQWPRYLAVTLSCGLVWFLIGLWIQQLKEARPLSRRSPVARGCIVTAAILLLPLAGFGVYLGIQGGYEGPTTTVAGYVMPVLLFCLALADLGVLPAALRRRRPRAAVALLFALLYAWTDASWQKQWDENQLRETKRAKLPPGQIEFRFPFQPRPETADSLAFHAPALLFAELPTMWFPDSHAHSGWRLFRTLVVWIYWLVILAGLDPQSELAQNARYRECRPLLRGIANLLCLFLLLSWLVAASNHSPTPVFGALCGTIILVYALRPPPEIPSEST